MNKKDQNILWFKDIDKEDIPYVGGKGANLGEMYGLGIPVPNGFVITAKAYFDFIKENDLFPQIKKLLTIVDKNDPHSYAMASDKIKKLILGTKIPKPIAMEIMKAYLELSRGKDDLLVAVRSSATAEDLPTASFAGQQRTFLNISGESNVVLKTREAWASLFEPRAIFYRDENKFDHFKVGLAVPVQKMIQSEKSGVMFTINPMDNVKDQIVIEAVYGLGEYIVQGTVTPDRYVVNKNSLKIIEKSIAIQPVQLAKLGKVTKEIKVSKNRRAEQKITNRQIIDLAKFGKKLQAHYFFPQDVEWAIEKEKIYLVQTRPVTTTENKVKKESATEIKTENTLHKTAILSGIPAAPGMATGLIKIIKTSREINKINNGDVLVTEMTTPDFVPAMKKAVAIVTDKGGQTSHAAIVSRELGIPCVVGTQKATQILKNGMAVTVNGSKGDVYKASFNHHDQSVTSKTDNVPITGLKTATKLYVNLAEPELASQVSKQNVDGVGLLRAEFMIANLGVHPKKMVRDGRKQVFINQLAQGISRFCEQFYPRPVIYRASDFKTNEYRHLVGGKMFEPEEANPMLGYRGAFRYLSDPGVFELELEAIKKVRRDYNNLWLMIPFLHTPWELSEVKKYVVSCGLTCSESFKLFMMVEIPSNVILLEDFIKIGIDGVSIGSNDLTMLILGIDRDNDEVAKIFNERDPAVLWALEKVVKTCHKYGITCSICGQAASSYPDLVEKLISWGISSVSVNPDAINATREIIYQAESKIINK